MVDGYLEIVGVGRIGGDIDVRRECGKENKIVTRRRHWSGCILNTETELQIRVSDTPVLSRSFCFLISVHSFEPNSLPTKL